jgi:hypothetical protein
VAQSTDEHRDAAVGIRQEGIGHEGMFRNPGIIDE